MHIKISHRIYVFVEWTVYTTTTKCGSSLKKEMQGAADLFGCEELFAERHWLWPILFDWVCLLTSPAVVNCIKAVSGSMATFYNSYFNRERISKAQRISAGKDIWDKTNYYLRKKKNHQERSRFLWNVSVQHVEHRQHIHKNEILH